MPNVYDDIHAEIMDIVDDTFGERLQILPRTKALGERSAPDPERASVIVVGVLRRQSSLGDRGAFQGGQWNGEMPTDYATIYIQHTVTPDYGLRDGDQIQAIDRPGEPFFEIAKVNRDHVGRLEIRVTPL